LGESNVRVFDRKAEQNIIEAIDRAKDAGDTLGGIVECRFRNVPIGVGSHVQWDRKLDALIAQAVMSIQAVKAVEIGAGVQSAISRGSDVHDAIILRSGVIAREQNNAGGIEGGMSNGEEIVVRASMKPISTLMQPLQSIDLATGEPTAAHIERSDVCAVPALCVIVEQAVAFTIANQLLETFGGDTVSELLKRVTTRRTTIKMRTNA
jgi:chorismate synthase